MIGYGTIIKWTSIGLGSLFLFFALINVVSNFGYVWYNIGDDEIGVKFQSNLPYEVVPSGIYSEFGLFKSIRGVKVRELNFRMADEEVLTHDFQRIGVVVTGTVRRPGKDNPEVLLANWARFKSFYTDDVLLVGKEEIVDKDTRFTPGLIQSLGQQASKVCIGDRNFNDAVLGSARDELRACIDKELSGLAAGYGLTVSNVVVPNVILSGPVQQKLDAITEARLSRDLAQQRQLQAEAEARQELAKQQGQILVEQGRVQEKAKQDKLTADLERQAKEAQNAVITADKTNVLLAAQKDKEIADVNRQTAEINAVANVAKERTVAEMYQGNPAYVEYQRTLAMANAYKNTDKVLMIPNNTNPLIFFGDPKVPVTVPIPNSPNSHNR